MGTTRASCSIRTAIAWKSRLERAQLNHLGLPVVSLPDFIRTSESRTRWLGRFSTPFDRVDDANELKNIIHTAPQELVERLRRRTEELIAQSA